MIRDRLEYWCLIVRLEWQAVIERMRLLTAVIRSPAGTIQPIEVPESVQAAERLVQRELDRIARGSARRNDTRGGP